MGCVVELLHSAMLIHDDVVDQAPLRRGRPSANARWGNDASVLVGDHLYSKSFALMVQDGDAAVLETLARATVSMTEAEVFRLERKRSGTTSESDYLRIITQKTASFMSACCLIGALLARAAEKQVDGLTRFGLDIGIAFQMSDASLDVVAGQARLGKSVSADLTRAHPVPAPEPGAGAVGNRGDPPPGGEVRGRRIHAGARSRVRHERQRGAPPVQGRRGQGDPHRPFLPRLSTHRQIGNNSTNDSVRGCTNSRV